jgi:hypothetical protein
MIEAILAGFFLGAANSLRCTSICLPILSVQLLSSKGTVNNSLLIVGLFSLGRLVSYLAVATIFYFAASYVGVLNSPYVKGSSMVLLGLIMIYYCYRSLVRDASVSCKDFSKGRFPLALGYLTSFSVCLPLLSVLSVYSDSSISLAYVAVGMFWVGSSILPLVAVLPFVGLFRLKNGSFIQRIALIGGLASGLLGLIFVVSGLQMLIG